MGLELDVLLHLLIAKLVLILLLLLLPAEPLGDEAAIGPCKGHSAAGLVKNQWFKYFHFRTAGNL
jgi:hypothetical protein